MPQPEKGNQQNWEVLLYQCIFSQVCVWKMKIINSVRYRAKGSNSSTIIFIIMCFNTQPSIAMTPRDSAMLTRQLFAKYLETFFHWLLLSSTQNFHIKKTRILTSIFHFMSDSKELTWVTNQHLLDPQCKYTYERSGSTFLAACKTTF